MRLRAGGEIETVAALCREFGVTELAVPWDLLGWMVALSAVVGVVAALWPATRAARLPVLQAVTYE